MPEPDDRLQQHLAGQELGAARDDLNDLDTPAIVRELGRLGHRERALAFRLLDKARAVEVFEDLDPTLASELMDGLREESVAALLADLDPDDRASLLDELPAGLASKLLRGLSPAERSMTETLLGYPEESAGRRMSPEVAWIPESFSVGAALARLRETGAGAETIYMVPVVGPGRLLRGVVSLRGLLVASDDAPVAELMSRPVFVRAEEDRELAARRIRDHGMIGLPVVDNEERLVGVITVDDAMRILAEEEDEDAARAGGTDPLRRPYLATSIPRLVRSRVVWLLILIGAATLTVNVLDLFEDALAQVVTLALFIPLLIGTGGNAGAQTVSTVIRALSTGDVDVRDVPRVVGREFLTGLALGGVLGGGAGLLAGVVFGSSIGLVLGLSLVAVCALATTVGALVPLASSRIGVDPAVVSAPFITTIVDATGLIVYFLIARAVLGI